jgi:HEAT repeat protein
MNTVALLDRLQHGDRHVRDEAFDQIARSRDLALLEPLAERAGSGSTYLETLLCQYLENVPAKEAIPHLERLLHSPHSATRVHALNTLDQIEIEQRLTPLIDLLTCPHRDVQFHALNELGVHRRSVAFNAIRPLLSADDQELSSAAFAAIQRIDAPRAIRMLVPFLDDPVPWRQIAALEALGGMTTFTKWKRLLTCLAADDPQVRRAAVLNLSRKGRQKINKHLIHLLEREENEEVAKLVINRLALHPDEKMAPLLIATAATHENPQIRRSAGWVIEELEEELLQRAMHAALPKGDEEVQAYILTKMGMRQLPGCGAVIAEYARSDRPPRVFYAALEGLGFLGDRELLPAVVPHLQSKDPMAAYVATLAAVQLIKRLDDCPELVELLLSPDAGHVALKQVVLQYMIDAISWDFEDSTLFRVLVDNLQSRNENIRYLSLILLGKGRGQHQLVAPLLDIILDEQSADMRQAGREALDQVLDGDLSPLLDLMRHERNEPADLCTYAGLMADMHWNSESVPPALDLFANFPCPEGMPQADQFRHDIASSLYGANPQACRDFFAHAPATDHWRLAIGQVWIDSLKELGSLEARSDWQALFVAGDPELIRATAARAVQARAKWAVEPMIARIARQPDESVAPDLRNAVKELLEM